MRQNTNPDFSLDGPPGTGTPAPHSVFWDDILPWLGFAVVPGAAAAAGAFGGGAAGASGASGTAAGGGMAGLDGSGMAAAGAAPGTVGGAAGVGGGSIAGGSGAAAGAWTTERIAKLALSLGIPVAQLTTLLHAANGGANGIPGPFGAQINDTLGLMNDRLRSTIPVHDAAMQLAMKMGAPSNPDPALLSSASNAVRSPAPTLQPSPQVANAAALMMKRFGG